MRKFSWWLIFTNWTSSKVNTEQNLILSDIFHYCTVSWARKFISSFESLFHFNRNSSISSRLNIPIVIKSIVHLDGKSWLVGMNNETFVSYQKLNYVHVDCCCGLHLSGEVSWCISTRTMNTKVAMVFAWLSEVFVCWDNIIAPILYLVVKQMLLPLYWSKVADFCL